MRVAIYETIDKNSQFVHPIDSILRQDGFTTDRFQDFEELRESCKQVEYTAILFDLMNEVDIAVAACIKNLREDAAHQPLMVLTNSPHAEFRTKVFNAGADECLTRPYDRHEVVARLRAIIRRVNGYSESSIRVGKLRLDLHAQLAFVDEKPLSLTAKEYKMLELLCLRKGMTLTKEMFLNHLYNGIDEPELKIIDVFICKLRKKLSTATGGPDYIETIWGRGYSLREPVAESETSPALQAATA